MTTKQKIIAAEQRIKELQTLIRYWKASEASSDQVAFELIEGLVNEDYEKIAS